MALIQFNANFCLGYKGGSGGYNAGGGGGDSTTNNDDGAAGGGGGGHFSGGGGGGGGSGCGGKDGGKGGVAGSVRDLPNCYLFSRKWRTISNNKAFCTVILSVFIRAQFPVASSYIWSLLINTNEAIPEILWEI